MVSLVESLHPFQIKGTKSIIDLNQIKGTKTILVFYPENNTPVCTSQLSLYNEVLPFFERHQAKIFGISVDSQKSHKKFSEKLNLSFDLLSDSDPQGAFSKELGVYDEETSKSKRALIVLDEDATVVWKQIVPYHINPGAEGILSALEDMSAQK